MIAAPVYPSMIGRRVLLDRLTAPSAGGAAAWAEDGVLQLELPPDRSSPGLARTFLAQAARNWDLDEETLQAAILAVSELVTNAVLHAETPALLLVEHDGHNLTLAVADGEAKLPQLGDSDPDDESGRGVSIIDKLGATWGTQRTVLGKTVWVSFAL
jgi:anti-sigma regulatory factor (Ser/Thr protein kinase)